MGLPNETVTFAPRPGPGRGDLTEQLLATSIWSDEDLAAAGIPVRDVPFVSVGGGIGSFVLVDLLRITGVPADQIRVLGQFPEPYHQYAFLCKNSQIPDKERLRSDSGSCPDNVWGFPAYAIREAFAEKTLDPLWNVLTEPILRDYWTPRAGTVFRGMDREAQRIGWRSMLDLGQVRVVRRRHGGGYFTILTPPEGTTPTKRLAFRSRFTHIAVGYPALRFLPDLQDYRERYRDFTHVINAYEPHEHVYDDFRRRPGTILVRGSGIVASRILQRLVDDRDQHGARTTIVHLFRTYRDGAKGDRRWGLGKRKAKEGWAYQGFNVTKATWGGQHRDKLLKLEGADRKAFIGYIGGGAHTPNRKSWKEQLARGKREGFYHQLVGEVQDVTPGPEGRGVTSTVKGADGSTFDVVADYVIDCTGLEGGPRDHRLLGDLLDHGGAGPNPLGRLDCEPSFEVRGTRTGEGRLYASGAATAGAYYGGVDSFLGLQYVAQRIQEDLVTQRFCKPMSPGRSFVQWTKWMRGKAP